MTTRPLTIVAAGDSHGDLSAVRHIVAVNPMADYYLYLGDSELTPQELAPFVSVEGNRDLRDFYPPFKRISTPFGDIYLEHGHLKTLDPDASGALIFLQGHTHCHGVRRIKDTYLANPGSTSRPRDGSGGTYLVITLDGLVPHFEFRYLNLF